MRLSFAIIIACLPCILGGCTAALIGAGVGTGVVAGNEVSKHTGKQKRFAKRQEERNVEEKINQERQFFQRQLQTSLQATKPTGDQRIRENINAALLGGQLTHVLSVNADVRAGVVTLFGTVPNVVIADRAVAAARRIPGVRQVVSRLFINEREIKPILDPAGKPVRPPYPHQQKRLAPPQARAPQPGVPPVGAVPQQRPQFAPPQGQVQPAPPSRRISLPPGAVVQSPQEFQPATPQYNPQQLAPRGAPPPSQYYYPPPQQLPPQGAVNLSPREAPSEAAIAPVPAKKLVPSRRPPIGMGKEHWFPQYQPEN